jgi:hypothetical protein
MPNILLMPPQAVVKQTIVVNGRTYSATPGQTLTVLDFDAFVLTANGRTGPVPQSD